MKTETMLLGILANNMKQYYIYMIPAASVIMVTKWKAKKGPTCEIWRYKMAEYVVMTKLKN